VSASIEHSIEIAAVPAWVWHVLTHGAEYALQSDGTREVVTSAQQEGVGITMQLTRVMGPMTLTLHGVFTEWEYARRMSSTWSNGFPFRMTTRVRMLLEPSPGGTRLVRRYEWNFGLPLLGPWLAKRSTPNATRDMLHLMERIKAAAEMQDLSQ
jgi:hypothetical protein